VSVGQPVRVRLGPLCMVVPFGELEAWISDAAPGDRFIYARGQALAHKERTVILARDYAQAGLVTTLQKVVTGADGRRETEYLCERREVLRQAQDERGLVAGADPLALAFDDVADGEALEAIYRAFVRAAKLKLVAPTNSELAEALNLRDKRRVRYLVGKLISRSIIRIQDNGPRARRIVTITATGKSTVPGRV